MAGTFQESLLDLAAPPGPAPLAESVCRRALPPGAWLDIRPGWLAGADELFGHLLTAVPWRAERRLMYDRVVDVPRPMVSPCQATLSRPSRYRHSPAVHSDSPSSGP